MFLLRANAKKKTCNTLLKKNDQHLMKMGGGRGGICALLILSLAWCRISNETHTDCVFQHQVPTSIHHRTTLGQIHQKQSNPWSDYLIHVDLRLVNSPICMYSAEKRVIIPLREWKQWREGARLFPLFIFSASQRASTLFIARRMSASVTDWSTFKVCIAYVCLIWEDWPSLILSWHVRWV